MKGILHIKLFEYLIRKDGAFGHVEIRSFLLENFKNVETERSRVEMSRFLKLLISENYIEYVNLPNTNGIKFSVQGGRFIPSNEISAIVRIKPKAVELVNSYINNKTNTRGMILSLIISFLAILFSIYVSIFQNKPHNDYNNLNEKLNKLNEKVSLYKTNVDSIFVQQLKINQQLKKKQE